MNRSPQKYLDRLRGIPESWHKALEEFSQEARLKIADRTVYDYLSRMKSILKRFCSERFDLTNPTHEQIKEIARKIGKCKLSEDTKSSYFKTLKKFYKVYKDGKLYKLTDCFTVSGSNATVERHMILSPKEIDQIVNHAQNIRDRAFFRLMYECAATPGELLKNKVMDVDLEEETIYVRGNKTHRSQTMELHHKGLAYLRQCLKQHPAVDDIFSTNSDAPLWVKIRNLRCRNCGKVESQHQPSGCKFQPKTEPVGYRSFHKSFKRAVSHSSVDRQVMMKYFRKSMLTLLCSKGIGYEQLNNFARWKPGSNQAGHYVSISNKDLRRWVRSRFKNNSESGQRMIVCENCESRNPIEAVECKRCHRPLNAPKTQRMERAKKIADQLAKLGDEELRAIKENVELFKNPKKFIKKEVKEVTNRFSQKKATKKG